MPRRKRWKTQLIQNLRRIGIEKQRAKKEETFFSFGNKSRPVIKIELPGGDDDTNSPVIEIDLPGEFEDLPVKFEDLPVKFEDLPGELEDTTSPVIEIDLTGEFEDLPVKFEDLSREFEDQEGSVIDSSVSPFNISQRVQDLGPEGSVIDSSLSPINISQRVQDLEEELQSINRRLISLNHRKGEIETALGIEDRKMLESSDNNITGAEPNIFFIGETSKLMKMIGMVNENRKCVTRGCRGLLVPEQIETLGKGCSMSAHWKCSGCEVVHIKFDSTFVI